MSRLTERFAACAAENRGAFAAFVMAGDPDLATSQAIFEALPAAGADIVELGMPFSDPMADGPTIQASSQRALENGVRLADVLNMVVELRAETDVPIILFSYLNPLFRYGIDRLAADAAPAGVDGILVTDAVDDEADEIGAALRKHDLDLISLVAPTTTEARLEKIAERSSGFIYAVARAGVTGARNEMSKAAEGLVRRVRKFTDLPVAVGFGISTSEQIEDVWRYADAAVVGSAIVAEIERSIAEGDTVECVRQFVSRLLPAFAKDAVEI